MGEEKEGSSDSSTTGTGSSQPPGASTATTQEVTKAKALYRCRNVWARNLEEEFKLIRAVVRKYPYIAMDTEFPGVVARPIGEFKSPADFQYQLLKTNVNMLKLIQLGLTFFDENGDMPPENSTWQFNFKFNLQDDMFAQDSIDLLHRAGIQFAQHEKDGIRIQDFGELLTTSGLVLQNNVRWVSFHSGYDFGYLLRTLVLRELPMTVDEFFDLLTLFFPNLYDIKIMLKQPETYNSVLKGGLQEIADQLKVDRLGIQHQAGSDSLLTGLSFFKLRDNYFSESWDGTLQAVNGRLYGLSQQTNNNQYDVNESINPTGGTQPLTRNQSTTVLSQQSLSQRNSPVRGLSPSLAAANRQSSVGDVSTGSGTETDVIATTNSSQAIVNGTSNSQ